MNGCLLDPISEQLLPIPEAQHINKTFLIQTFFTENFWRVIPNDQYHREVPCRFTTTSERNDTFHSKFQNPGGTFLQDPDCLISVFRFNSMLPASPWKNKWEGNQLLCWLTKAHPMKCSIRKENAVQKMLYNSDLQLGL